MRVGYELADGTQVPVDGHKARWVFVVNLPDYAGGLRLAPDAVGTDGMLDVCTFGQGSLWHGLKYLGFVAIGQHKVLADCTTARVRRVRIESTEEVRYQLDGDPGGFLPLEIEVLPERMTLVAPYSRLLALGLKGASQASAPAW